MIPKQDRQGVRTARDIEQKYDLNTDFSSIEQLASNANKAALSAMSSASNAMDLVEELSQSTAEQFEAVIADVGELSESVGIHSENILNLDERVTVLEESDLGGEPGEDGATFTPSVDSAGNLSWTNDKGLANPATVNIKGGNGDKGDTGANGVSCTHSWSGTTLTVTSASGTSSADLKGEKGDKGDKGDGVSFTTDDTLTLSNGTLKVNTANTVTANSTLPVTSAAVYSVLGDIESLLATI